MGAIAPPSASSLSANCLTRSHWSGDRLHGWIRNALTACGDKEVRFFPGLPSFGLSTGARSWSISGLISRLDPFPDPIELGVGLGQTRVIGGQFGLGPNGAIVLVPDRFEDA